MKATHATAFGRTIGSLETAETIEAPQDWRTIPTAYILPSEAYKGALEGHPRSVDIIERLGGHLDIVNDGEAIALILLLDLARPSQWLTPTYHPSIADMPIGRVGRDARA